MRDEVFFAVDKVFTAGQPIGMILADSALHAAAGARAVAVQYEELPQIFSIEEDIEKERFFQHFKYIKKGDTDKAFSKADHVITDVSRMGGQKHFYISRRMRVLLFQSRGMERLKFMRARRIRLRRRRTSRKLPA